MEGSPTVDWTLTNWITITLMVVLAFFVTAAAFRGVSALRSRAMSAPPVSTPGA